MSPFLARATTCVWQHVYARLVMVVGLGVTVLCMGCDGQAAHNKVSSCAGWQTPKQSVSLRELGVDALTQDRVLLVNVWALWCAPCRQELPVLDHMVQHEDIAIVALNMGDRPSSIKRFAQKKSVVTLDLSRKAPEDVLTRLGAKGLPFNALFVDGELYAVRNRVIKDESALRHCLQELK